MNSTLYLPMAALLITAAVAGPSSAAEELPFFGVLEGTEDFDFAHPSGIDIKILGSGGGNASQLGAFTSTWDVDITLANLVQPIERTFVAANGDELYSEGLGAGTPPPDQFVVETHIITGGTGRFFGATGSFVVERTVFDVGNPGFTDLETSGSFSGTIMLKPVPFSGVIEGTEDFDFEHPSGIDIKIVGTGGGKASHMGAFAATWDADITLANLSQPIRRTFIAANGDELYTEGFGAGTPPPDQFVVETHVITGGTGRFSGATGSLTVERWVFDVGNPGFSELETSGSFDGFIIFAAD